LGWDSLYPWAYHLLRIGLGCIFIYAGVLKLLHPHIFAHSLAQYDLLPDPLVPVVALGLPALELLAGLGLVLEVRGSLPVISLLLLIFLAILGYAVLLDLDIDCGCFSLEELGARTSVKTAFWRDLLMVAATLLLFWGRRARRVPRLGIKRHQ
jgi:uncharacterized membrane protein YphA (DoxX/SURF4 family)